MSQAPTAVEVRPPAASDAPARAAGGRRRFIVLGVVAALSAGGYGLFRALTSNRQTTDDAQVEADVVPVAVRVGGPVRAVKVQDNARVKKGDVLLELDPADLEARAKQAEGELKAAQAQAAAADALEQVSAAGARGGLSTARAQVSTSVAQVSSAEAQIASAHAQLLRAESDARKAATDLERAKQLKAANAVPQERLDNAQSSFDAAQASLAAAKAQLSAAEESRRVAQSRVAEATGMVDTNNPVDAKIAAARANADLAHARVLTAEAALDLARLNLSYAVLRSPIDGVISRLSVREGQLLAPSQPVAELVPERTYVVANFKETQLGAIKAGQRVDIEVDAFPGKHLEGVVESIAGGTGSRFSLLPPDNASGNFVKVVQRVPVRVQWKEVPSGITLRAGMSAVATVHTGE